MKVLSEPGQTYPNKASACEAVSRLFCFLSYVFFRVEAQRSALAFLSLTRVLQSPLLARLASMHGSNVVKKMTRGIPNQDSGVGRTWWCVRTTTTSWQYPGRTWRTILLLTIRAGRQSVAL